MPEVKRKLVKYDEETIEEAAIQMKYASYIQKEKEQAEKLKRLERIRIPESLDYSSIKGLSAEATEKLNRIKPGTIAQAGRISGVSPSDISILLVYLGR